MFAPFAIESAHVAAVPIIRSVTFFSKVFPIKDFREVPIRIGLLSFLNSARRKNQMTNPPEKSRPIIVGSRASQLALIQAESVIGELTIIHPQIEFAIEKIKTRGDEETKASLTEIGGQGVFVKELEEALLAGTIDMAVHSIKDMPTLINRRLKLAAITERADARDVLVSGTGKGLMELPSGATIGTGSQRRAVQIHACRPDLQVRQIRGNVDTRLKKTFSGEFDGIILAAAALIRMGWQNKITEYLPLDSFLPAVGQGALAVVIRADDMEMEQLVLQINNEPTYQSVLAERSFLLHLGGGCRAPIAALGVVKDDILELQGMIASADGNRIMEDRQEGHAEFPDQAGRLLAQKMIQKGANQLLKEDNE